MNRETTLRTHSAERHWADSLWFRLLLVATLGLGIFFRLSGLGTKLYSHDETYTSLDSAGYVGGEVFASLWDGTDKTADDLQKFLRPAQDRNILRTLSIVARFEPHEAPLFFLLTHIWMRAVGYTPADLRLAAALISLLCLPALYWLAMELFGSRRTALLATALLAISPYQIIFAQDARPYSLWTWVTLLSSAALLRALRKNDLRSWLAYCLTLILGMYSHQLFALVAIVHALFVAGKGLLRSPKTYSGFFTAAVIAFLAYIPWILTLISGWNHVSRRMAWANIRVSWEIYIKRWLVNFGSPFVDMNFNSSNVVPYLMRIVILLVIAAAFLYLLKKGTPQQKKFLLLLYILPVSAFIVPDVLLGGIRSIGGRYFVPTSLAAILVMAFFLAGNMEQAGPVKSIHWKILTGLVMGLAVLSNIYILQAETWWNKELGRVRPEFVHHINHDGSLLIVSGENPTNLGDILPLSFKVDADVRFRLHEDPQALDFTHDDRTIYWFPSSRKELAGISQSKGLQTMEVVGGSLWQIQAPEN